MLVAFSISPSGGDGSGGVSEAVAEAVRVVRASGLPCETNAMFTNVEGEWDEVMDVVRRAVDVVAATSPRVGLVLKADIRPGFTDQLTSKVERVEAHLAARRTEPHPSENPSNPSMDPDPADPTAQAEAASAP